MVPDYYARLEVDPSADRAEIAAALDRKQPLWSMGTRNPKNRHAYQLYLDEVPALRRALLGDDAARAAYDAELAVARRAERQGQLDVLERRIRLRAAKGGLGAADRALLADLAKRLGLSDDDLHRLIRPIPMLAEAPDAVADAAADVEPPPDVLDASTSRQIKVALEHLGCRDLYHALGVTRDAPASDIAARADAERQRWMRKSQVTAAKTAWLEVVAHAQSHLGSPRARARYDRTLALEAEASFDELAGFALDGLARLDAGTRATLIAEAGTLGIAPDRADRLIGRVCRRLGVARDGISTVPAHTTSNPQGPPGAGSVTGAATGNGVSRFTLLRCRECGGVTEISPIARKAVSARCPHCGSSLRWDCPVCRRTPWVDEPRCPCGFRMALREPVLRHFEAAQRAFRAAAFTEAIDDLQRVLELAPDHAAARSALVKIRQRQAEVARLQLAYRTALAAGRLVAARTALEAWGRLADSQSPELQAARAELTPLLRRALTLAARSRVLERTEPSAARSGYRQCLEIAADLPEALAGLARTPPDPPLALDARVLGDRIRLVWTPPPPDGCGPLRFVVLRKRDGTLQHPGDGTRIAEVDACEFDDLTVNPGDSVSYAVLTRRGGVESLGAISLGPFLYLADVQDVHVAAREDGVDIAWRPPPGIAGIRVARRRDLAPANPRDGDRVVAGLDALHDGGLDAGRVYFYAIYAVYKMPDGRMYPSPGVLVSARPGAPPSPRPDLRPEGWPGRLERAGLPADPTDLRASRFGGSRGGGGIRVMLRWQWAPEVDSVLVAARPSRPPAGPDDPLATTAIVDRDDYDRQEGWTLALPGSSAPADRGEQTTGVRHANGQGSAGAPRDDPGGPWHIRVYSIDESRGARVFSAGIEPTAATVLAGPNPEVTVSYDLNRPWRPGAAWSLTLRTEPAGAATPPLVVVAHPRAVPLSVDDGQIVARLPAARDGERARFAIPFRLGGQGVRLFPDPAVPPDALVPIRLRHPESGSTRV